MATQYVMVVYNDRWETAHLYIGIPQEAFDAAAQGARIDGYDGDLLEPTKPDEAHAILSRAATHIFADYDDHRDMHGAVTDPCSFVMYGFLGPATEFHVHRASP